MNMKKVSLFIVAICLIACKPEVKTLPLNEFETVVRQSDAVLLDVRTWDEYASGHIVNAINVDWKSDKFEQQFAELGLDKDQAIAVYCLHAKRSYAAAKCLLDMGYKNVFQLEGGIEPWTELELVKEFANKDLLGKWQVCQLDSIDWLHIEINDICRFTGENESSFCAWLMFREDSTMGASVGCNGMGGRYTFARSCLTVTDCGATEMYCDALDIYERALFSFVNGHIEIQPYTMDSILLKHDNRNIILRKFK